MVQIFWSPLLVTPILTFCSDAESPLGLPSSVSGVAAILNFEPPLTLFLETASLVVLLVFCFSPSSDFLPLMRHLDWRREICHLLFDLVAR